MLQFKFQKQSLTELLLAEFYEDPKATAQHRVEIFNLAKIFLKNLANIQPSEIMTNSTLLLRLMREDHVQG